MKLTYGFIIGHMTLGIIFLWITTAVLLKLLNVILFFVVVFGYRCSMCCTGDTSVFKVLLDVSAVFPALSEFWRRRCSKTSSLQTFLQDFFYLFACTYYFISQPSKCPVFSAITLSVWKSIVHDLALKVFLWSLLTSKNLLLLKSARFWGGGAISPLRNALKKLIQFVNI